MKTYLSEKAGLYSAFVRFSVLKDCAIFFRALKRELDECSDRPGEFSSIGGSLRDLRNVEFVDQNPIGKSSMMCKDQNV